MSTSSTRTDEERAAHWARVQRYRATEKGAEVHRAGKTRYRENLREQTIAAYGGQCTCCGETEPVFLTIDHTNNDGGGRNRVESGLRLYARLKREGWPKDGYRLHCFNCNTGRHRNGGVCPHQQ